MQETDSLIRSKGRAFLLGICGGSGSGKTTLLRRLREAFPQESCAIFQDSYYIDQSAVFDEDGGEVNFDHPASIDFQLLSTHLKALRTGAAIEIPIYDFVTHTRKSEVEHQAPFPIVLVDGTLILSQENVRQHFDHSVFLEVPEHLRFERRKDRDLRERGRQLDGIVRQFYNHVKPMHDEFVEPSKIHADTVISEVRGLEKLITDLTQRLSKTLR
jgi:uridine kinase